MPKAKPTKARKKLTKVDTGRSRKKPKSFAKESLNTIKDFYTSGEYLDRIGKGKKSKPKAKPKAKAKPKRRKK